MRTLQTTIKPKRCFAVLATAIILLAATASASAKAAGYGHGASKTHVNALMA